MEVTPDRVLLQCELASEKKDVPYGFTIHVLDEQRTVLNVIQGNTLSKQECFRRLKSMNRILHNGRRIYIAGVGDIDGPRKTNEWKYSFPGIGTYGSNGRVLQFFVMENEHGEHGECFDAYYREEKPCPRGDEFPIKKNP